MKKFIVLFLVGLTTIILCNNVYASKTVDKGGITVYAGKSKASGISSWKIKAVNTSNAKIATISKKGVITGKLVGECYVYVKDLGNTIYRYKVKVVSRLNTSNVTIIKSKNYALKLYGTSIKGVASANKKAAIITKNGVIKAVGKGSSVVKIKGADNKIHSCKVKVLAPYLNKKSLTISLGDTYDLNLMGTDKVKVWSSADTDIVSINQAGVIRADQIGSTQVQVRSSGITYICKVKVVHRFTKWKGSKVSILGDSISTFKGYVPEGYRSFYPDGDITAKGMTWWGRLFRECDWKLVANASWSGSRVTGDASSTTVGRAACSTKRIEDLSKDGVEPEIIICYTGINDFGNCVEIGNWHKKHYEIEDDDYVETFSEAYGLMLQKIKERYPDATVYCCTLVPTIDFDVILSNCTNLLGYRLSTYNDVIKKIADYYNYRVIDLYTCGITTNTIIQYSTDGDTHPNKTGMILLKKKMVSDLKQYYK